MHKKDEPTFLRALLLRRRVDDWSLSLARWFCSSCPEIHGSKKAIHLAWHRVRNICMENMRIKVSLHERSLHSYLCTVHIIFIEAMEDKPSQKECTASQFRTVCKYCACVSQKVIYFILEIQSVNKRHGWAGSSRILVLHRKTITLCNMN